ncbi:MAG: hypothetical protein AAF565_09555 [Pseudomonadota bacterium]
MNKDENGYEPRSRGMERHMQTAAGALIIALCGWTVNETWQMSKTTAILEEHMRAIDRRMADLVAFTNDRYTASRAAQDMGRIERRLDGIERRLERVEHNGAQRTP